MEMAGQGKGIVMFVVMVVVMDEDKDGDGDGDRETSVWVTWWELWWMCWKLHVTVTCLHVQVNKVTMQWRNLSPPWKKENEKQPWAENQTEHSTRQENQENVQKTWKKDDFSNLMERRWNKWSTVA